MTRVLYLIASHTKPEQVMRLVKTIKLNSPDSYVLIHHDYSSSILNRSAFHQMQNVHVMENFIPITWGEFSLIEMELSCINWLFTHAIPFDWLVFLSGQDYPVQPISEIEQFLSGTEYDGFMEYFLATEPPLEPTESGLQWQADTGLKRFFYHHYKFPKSPILDRICFRLGRILNHQQPWITLSADRNGARLGVRCVSTPFHSAFLCYAGSQWHTLSYRCVEYIHKFAQKNPTFIKHYRNTIIPDESFFQTILLNNSQLKICNNNQRFISWNKAKPRVLGTQDFDRLITSGKQFARKLDLSIDAEIFDRLDQHLHTQTKNLYHAMFSINSP